MASRDQRLQTAGKAMGHKLAESLEQEVLDKYQTDNLWEQTPLDKAKLKAQQVVLQTNLELAKRRGHSNRKGKYKQSRRGESQQDRRAKQAARERQDRYREENKGLSKLAQLEDKGLSLQTDLLDLELCQQIPLPEPKQHSEQSEVDQVSKTEDQPSNPTTETAIRQRRGLLEQIGQMVEQEQHLRDHKQEQVQGQILES